MDGASALGTSAADLTRTLAARVSASSYDVLPGPVRALARQCVLDYLGVALAGADDPLVAILLDELSEAGGTPQASVIGHEASLPALSAALVNGAIGHALDYDDVNLAMPGHPSVAILPGLLALAEERRSSGRDVVTAFVASYETACRIGSALRPGHYNLGFHSTGIGADQVRRCIGRSIINDDDFRVRIGLGQCAIQCFSKKTLGVVTGDDN